MAFITIPLETANSRPLSIVLFIIMGLLMTIDPLTLFPWNGGLTMSGVENATVPVALLTAVGMLRVYRNDPATAWNLPAPSTGDVAVSEEMTPLLT